MWYLYSSNTAPFCTTFKVCVYYVDIMYVCMYYLGAHLDLALAAGGDREYG